MSDQIKEQPQITPFEFLQTFPEAPSLEQIEQWKQQAPGARLRIWHSTDGKRVYVLRAIGGQELGQLQASLPPNIPPEKVQAEVQILLAIRCCVWTSSTIDHKLFDLALKGAGAGLPQTLQEIIYQLSDYMDPMDINRFSADL
jgi:hypothetical protein